MNKTEHTTHLTAEITFDNMPKAIARVCDEVSAIIREVSEIKKNFTPKTPTEYLTRDETAEFFKCDRSTIHNWTKKGKLRAYGIGNRCYYKREEVEAALLPLNSTQAA